MPTAESILNELPEPQPQALAHSEALTALISREIEAAGGHISFERYMQLALHAPALGYYTGGAAKLGAAGDFVTAPELSPLFSRCIARQVASLMSLDVVLELGAGRGVMALELLRELDRLGVRLRRYCILEPSAELRQRQQSLLADAGVATPVEWLDDFPAPGFEGVVLANEVVDAMPVRRFVAGDPVGEVCIGREAGCFTSLVSTPAADELRQAVRAIESAIGFELPPGYVSEIGLTGQRWMREMASRLGRGVMLLFDYGYSRTEFYHPERNTGTLTCFYRHRRHHDPLLWPGLQDITAHVDFSALAEAAESAGATLAGYTTQANFLIACGLPALLEGLDPATPEFVELAGQARRLMLPGEMGEIVKVIAISQKHDDALLGFSERDLRARL